MSADPFVITTEDEDGTPVIQGYRTPPESSEMVLMEDKPLDLSALILH